MFPYIIDIKTDNKKLENEIRDWCTTCIPKDKTRITPTWALLIYRNNSKALWGFSEEAGVFFQLRWTDVEGVRFHRLTEEDLKEYY